MIRPPGYATPAAPAEREPCAACGEPVSAADPGGFWMLEGAPRHAGCIDWSTRPFPYAWALEAGERAIRRDPGGADDELKRAVTWLRRAAGRWKRANHVTLLASAARAAAVVSAATGPGQGATRDPTPGTLGARRS